MRNFGIKWSTDRKTAATKGHTVHCSWELADLEELNATWNVCQCDSVFQNIHEAVVQFFWEDNCCLSLVICAWNVGSCTISHDCHIQFRPCVPTWVLLYSVNYWISHFLFWFLREVDISLVLCEMNTCWSYIEEVIYQVTGISLFSPSSYPTSFHLLYIHIVKCVKFDLYNYIQ